MVRGVLASLAILLLLSTAVWAADDGQSTGGAPGFNGPFGSGPAQNIGGIVAALGAIGIIGAFTYNPGIFSVGGSSSGGGSNSGRNAGDSQR